MFPLRDANPSRSFPVVTVILIAVNVLIFLYEYSLGRELNAFFNRYALIPANVFNLNIAREGGISYFERIYPFITSQFLHGGWFHMIGNVWFLWIFGDNVEDYLGHSKFIFFYLLCGVAAGLAHVYTNPGSMIPTVGASGAIAGIMGAYTVKYPKARVLTLIIFIYFIRFIELPAYIFLGVWFLIQFFSGAMAHISGSASSGVAWWAHIGGFVVGVLLILILPKRKFQQGI
jgi:membrane associated rhomboid family serine protease